MTAKGWSSEYVICPYCGYEHGDAWETCPNEDMRDIECCGCRKTFVCWAQFDVTYHSMPKRSAFR